MEKRLLGSTGLEVTVLGIGGIPLTHLSKPEAVRVVQTALDEGIQVIETARGYRDAEEKMGEAIKGRREECIIISKYGAGDKQRMGEAIDTSLKMLQTDYIDIYQIHGLRSMEVLQRMMNEDGAMAALKEAQQAGKIGHIGFTTHWLDTAVAAVRLGEFSSVQVPFNFIENEPLNELVGVCREHNVGIIGMKPLGGGLIPYPDLALRWLLEQPLDLIPIGMESVEEVNTNVRLARERRPLSAEEQGMLEAAAQELGKRFCRKCGYCMPCPNNVPISSVMLVELMYKRNGPEETLQAKYLEHLAKVEECVECGECVRKCPYELPIPEIIRELAAKYLPLLEEYRAKREGP
jgi:predicted aldo/keto reductase-like oxidoreductase